MVSKTNENDFWKKTYKRNGWYFVFLRSSLSHTLFTPWAVNFEENKTKKKQITMFEQQSWKVSGVGRCSWLLLYAWDLKGKKLKFSDRIMTKLKVANAKMFTLCLSLSHFLRLTHKFFVFRFFFVLGVGILVNVGIVAQPENTLSISTLCLFLFLIKLLRNATEPCRMGKSSSHFAVSKMLRNVQLNIWRNLIYNFTTHSHISWVLETFTNTDWFIKLRVTKLFCYRVKIFLCLQYSEFPVCENFSRNHLP